MVTHGLAVRVISSGVRSGSTSTGLVVAMGTSWHRRPEASGPYAGARARVDRPAHRPLRADHAAGGAGVRYGAPTGGLRALSASPPRGPTVRRGGRRRPRPRRGRGLPLRRRDARGAARRGGRADPRVAGVVPLHRRRLGLPRGRGVPPLLTARGG